MSEIEDDLFKGTVRNLNRLVILWLLSEETRSGYSILKEMRKIADQNLHPGVVYPLLHELVSEEYIVGNKVQKGKRQIIYYTITDKGRALFVNLKGLFKLPVGYVLLELFNKKR